MNICVSIESTVTGSNIIKNNCFYNTYSSDVINYKGKMYTVGDANGKLIDFKNNIGSNPLFYKDQYTIQSDSPCKDTGETLPDVTEDYRKLKRPQDSDYDMGAMEYGGVMK
ncbi:hypothetical protein HY745_07230 [Candidatus Desantisbacteria bacterium]|nr:hypothetical protein [Candidatus Desantisbacteria bacterium]